ncbi:UPF0538 protein C2orf76 homolog [Dreissena polymorpha]|uniref:Uncharacterized protein n=1 Tax=Dreissena polymorpha TaxID=45954 RepID=A0A9D4C3M7_DREPO|nr:UPF0538 protein C2orf76 homolog [Dreissena polymorpha]XP_052246337.1 UPF0538 protein C2orf76 homolog [Dreissena polymorpha]XP_052246338.1 UPF0538 protein C2orf76 homolog [Dreissena polymorpha]KAH3716787.1 hypothetical protein DPMN_059516 [Dreissena polymorpha]
MSSEDTVVVTVRLIRSFEHRNIKHVVYRDIRLDQSVAEFIGFLLIDLKTRPGLPPPFKNNKFDTLKISHQPFGAKTSDPVINTDNDEGLMLQPDKTLRESHIVNETELSFFNMEEYRAYQKNPHLVW